MCCRAPLKTASVAGAAGNGAGSGVGGGGARSYSQALK